MTWFCTKVGLLHYTYESFNPLSRSVFCFFAKSAIRSIYPPFFQILMYLCALKIVGGRRGWGGGGGVGVATTPRPEREGVTAKINKFL